MRLKPLVQALAALIAAGGAIVAAPAAHAQQIVMVTNAVRYTPEGGQIRLRWLSGPAGGEFSVEDSGIGIEPEHLPRLTERFYRIDRSRSRETGGTGLGLSIVKHALARHQSTLRIESAPGKGSRFSARFPASRLLAAAHKVAG